MDIEEIGKKIEELFETKFGIYLFSSFMKSNVIILYPICSKNMLNFDNIKEIIKFFKNELKMNVKGINRKKHTNQNQIDIIEAYIGITIRIDVFITYFRDNEKEYFFLNFIEIKRTSEEVEEIIREKAKRDIEELERLMKKEED
jgi:hypothetical protein